jgi:hypothetical protein
MGLLRRCWQIALVLYAFKRPKPEPKRADVSLYRRRELDHAALRLAHRTPAPYDYCKQVLDMCRGDAAAAEAWIVHYCATTTPEHGRTF